MPPFRSISSSTSFSFPAPSYCYQTDAPARLGTLLKQGLLYFWRFVRITLLTLLVCALILGPLLFLQGKWEDHIDDHIVGRAAFLAILAGNIVLFLVASILRLYFDLVEVYTVQIGQHVRPSLFGEQGKPDRRVRRALSPAWRTLRANFSQAWPIFLFLTLLGFAAVILTARTSMHMLAQPRVLPTFLLAQLGLFLMLLTRFWQRGAETSLALQYPIPAPSPTPVVPVAGTVKPVAQLDPSRIHLAPRAPRHPRHQRTHLRSRTRPTIARRARSRSLSPRTPQTTALATQLTTHSPRSEQPETRLR